MNFNIILEPYIYRNPDETRSIFSAKEVDFVGSLPLTGGVVYRYAEGNYTYIVYRQGA